MTGQRVVVGIDGRPDCENAIRWGAAEAAARGVGLDLVHAFVWAEFRVPLGPSDMAPGLRAQADQIVAEAVALARKFEPGLPVTGSRVDGFPSAVLLAESRTADLIVLGSRVTGRLLGLVVSSAGIDLSAHAHCPVVVVRPGDDALVGSRVVIGYDGSPPADAAVEFGLDYARRHELAARIVTVLSDEDDDDHGLLAAIRPHAHEAEIVEVTGHPSELLLEWSADAQLLVVGSRGHGGFAGLLLGSVSQTMLHQAPCPVAVIPHAVVER
ncbi:nucleotide-binding universal stress UspA family protein [Kribbella sp. VKM Ac-2571]|uniref:universal stress protein n=1 Tax=Kribbella sp. VKM Ac-2571 TaxID=2512222 RepID=UPI001061656D|nr:universal stress protein [Kribbella sp. VKM Ac-2571]TDO48329.1 nucleotide-binding universal stress UspA family protein [Kribbella sp. VKM Ac-2571]